MPIMLPCDCGRRLKVKDDLAGRKVRCPECAVIHRVPEPEPKLVEDEALITLLEDSPSDDSSGRSRRERNAGITDRPRRRSEPEEDEEQPRRRRAVREEEDAPSRRRRSELEEDDAPPRRRIAIDDEDERDRRRAKRERRERPARRDTSDEGWFGNINGGMVGGLLMMLIAVVWFVGGLAVGFIFFYPPILFIIGIGAFFKGLFGRE